MTQLLISVKNVEESLLAMHAGIEIIDLKDPARGALGALPLDLSRQILTTLAGGALTSATVGEHHLNLASLIKAIKQYARLGLDIVKISVNEWTSDEQFFAEMQRLTAQGIKLVAVCFADQPINLACIPQLKAAGFHGAMLDTQQKAKSLLDVQSKQLLSEFTHKCRQHQLITGIAGSVGKPHLRTLLALRPDFIGMRGAVCNQAHRNSSLSHEKVSEIHAMLLNYNNKNRFTEHFSASSLHKQARFSIV